jgi:hypothetical protein
LKTGTRYRLRLINISTNEADLRVRLEGEGEGAPVQWKVIASDGADLPAAQLKSSAADMGLTVGSTRDIEYESDREGHVEMRISAPGFEALVMQPFDIVSAK